MPKDLTPSVSTFQNLIRGNYLYVDKTEYIWKLVQRPNGIYFLSRPRRFGKSLTISTLEAVFQGRRELFQGLAIDGMPYDWKEYPVLRISLGNCASRNSAELEVYLNDTLEELAKSFKVEISGGSLSKRFQALISSVNQGNGVVILVDEYDKPLLNCLGEPDLAQEMLPVLKGFYSTLKDANAQERFVFVTGVTKFCHVSLFSDLNNLQDISADPAYATMFGYTQEELEADFDEWLAEVGTRHKLSHEVLLRRLKLWYDGYRFAADAETVYNPVSIANFFLRQGSFENYWYATGTTGALFRLMKQDDCVLPEMMEGSVSGDLFESFDLERVDVQKLMYQTGYLTIGESFLENGGTDFEIRRYRLRFPNFEVRSSFSNQVMEHYAGCRSGDSFELIRELAGAIGKGDVDGFLGRIRILLARVPYNIHGRQEHDYQTILFVIFMMLNQYVEGEHHTSDGRADIVLHSGEWTYVMEFKLDHSAEAAMEQIRRKDYARGFLGKGRRVLAVGVEFDSEKGQLSRWTTEEIR